jgi:hypothetical protein
LRSYQSRHDIQFAFFCDEGISSVMLKRLSDEIPGSGIGLSFGLESGCQRIVSLMNKGFDLDTAESILDKCVEEMMLLTVRDAVSRYPCSFSSTQAILCPSDWTSSIPSASFSTSPFSRPMPIARPTMTIWPLRKKWSIVSRA